MKLLENETFNERLTEMYEKGFTYRYDFGCDESSSSVLHNFLFS